MRKLLFLSALWAIFLFALSLDVAYAQMQGPDPYGGEDTSHCHAPTHASYYDPRNEGQTAYNPDARNGDSVYYVDTDPLAGFDPDGDYETTQTADQDCKGIAALRANVYFAVTVHFTEPEHNIHIGYPTCPRDPGDDRNPYCEDDPTGAQATFYVGNGDGSQGTGFSAGVAP